MKEVTICFSFSVKDGLENSLYATLSTLVGWSMHGINGIERRKNVSKSVFSLLEGISNLVDAWHIYSVALRERNKANTPDDLETKNTTHAKGDKS